MNVVINLTLYMVGRENPVYLTTSHAFDGDYADEEFVDDVMPDYEIAIESAFVQKKFLKIHTLAVDMAQVQAASWFIYKETDK